MTRHDERDRGVWLSIQFMLRLNCVALELCCHSLPVAVAGWNSHCCDPVKKAMLQTQTLISPFLSGRGRKEEPRTPTASKHYVFPPLRLTDALFATPTNISTSTSFLPEAFRVSSSNHAITAPYPVCLLTNTCRNATIASLHS